MTELQILLIEDDDLLRKALFAQIQGWGHSVEACTCLTEAEKILSGGSFDDVFLDMRLPDGDGIEFLTAQKAEYPNIDFVIMTAFADVRIVAATRRDLKALIAEGKFREDLYCRLSVVPIVLPPLREHQSSIAPIADYYRELLSKEMGRTIKGFTKAAIEAMMKYSWPGNVRVLRNAAERSVILTNGDEIDVEALGIQESSSDRKPSASGVESAGFKPMSLADSEKNLIQSVLSFAEGNKNKAADILKIHRTTLYKKLQEYGLE